MCIYYYIKFIFSLSNLCVRLPGALVLTEFVVGSVFPCLRMDTKVIICIRLCLHFLNFGFDTGCLFLKSTVGSYVDKVILEIDPF